MSSSNMMDLVVVPTISLNPKKAKKKLKKAARMHEDALEPQLPVNDPCFGKEPVCVLEQNLSKTSSPAAKISMPAKKQPQSQPKVSFPAMPLLAAKASTPAPIVVSKSCAAEALVGGKRSWFDITEEDDDNFLGEWSTPQVVA